MSLDLNTIKDNVQNILEAANTTTASVDLSSGLERRVQKVLKVNPGRIPVQPSWFPFVTVFIESKDMNFQDIAATQRQAKRRADINFSIIGAVWNSTVSNSSLDEDPADDDCESLMESIEEIIRGNATLNGQALWTTPLNVKYYNSNYDEETHIRFAVMNIRASILY